MMSIENASQSKISRKSPRRTAVLLDVIILDKAKASKALLKMRDESGEFERFCFLPKLIATAKGLEGRDVAYFEEMGKKGSKIIALYDSRPKG